MPTLRRILKYTPAVVLGLLVVAWVVSLRWVFSVVVPSYDQSEQTIVRLGQGMFELSNGWEGNPYIGMWIFTVSPSDMIVVGWLDIDLEHLPDAWRVLIPIPLAVTAILPLAIGPFLSFRFRLWHYLAYTALVALELAYYLRWQE
jgi:hypothetical protein